MDLGLNFGEVERKIRGSVGEVWVKFLRNLALMPSINSIDAIDRCHRWLNCIDAIDGTCKAFRFNRFSKKTCKLYSSSVSLEVTGAATFFYVRRDAGQGCRTTITATTTTSSTTATITSVSSTTTISSTITISSTTTATTGSWGHSGRKGVAAWRSDLPCGKFASSLHAY